MTELWPGEPFPLGATWDGGGTNFSIFSEHATQGRAVPVRRRRGGADRAHGADRVQLARLPPADRPGSALRLPRPRAVRAGARPSLQSVQAAARPVREVDRGADPVRGRQRAALRAQRRGGRRPRARRRGRRGRDPEVRRHRPALRLGGRPAAAHAVAPDGDLRGARQGLHEAAPGRARGPAGNLRGARRRRRRRPPQAARGHRGRAPPRPPHRRRGLPPPEGADELLGLLVDRLLRAALRLRRDGRGRPGGARVQGHGQGPAPRRHRGDPRRGLQPHRRGQPPRADALLQGRRQQVLLPPHARGRALLHGLHGHGQLAQRGPPERAADDHGLAALLGHGVPRRRLPLRPRQRARPRALRRRPAERVLRHDPPGPDPLPGQADRRAVGRRAGRLPGRQLPRPVVGVERDLPRHDARLLARAGRRRRVRAPAHGLLRPLPGRRPAPVRVGQLHHRARRLHAARPRLLQRQAQRGQPGGQPRRDRRQPVLELRRRGGDRRSRR